MKITVELESVEELEAIFSLIRGENMTSEQLAALQAALVAQTAKSAEVTAALNAQP